MRGSHLERPQCLHPLVGLPEESQPEHSHDDDEQAVPTNATRSLTWTPAGTRPTARTSGLSAGLSSRRFEAPAAVSCCGTASCDNAQIFSSAVLPTKFVISHLAVDLRDVEIAGGVRGDLPGVDVDEVTLEVERAAVSVDGDLELVSGMVGQPVRRRASTHLDFNQTSRICCLPVTVFPGPNVPVALGANRPTNSSMSFLEIASWKILSIWLICVVVGLLLHGLLGSRAPARASAGRKRENEDREYASDQKCPHWLLLLPGPQGCRGAWLMFTRRRDSV